MHKAGSKHLKSECRKVYIDECFGRWRISIAALQGADYSSWIAESITWICPHSEMEIFFDTPEMTNTPQITGIDAEFSTSCN